MEPLISVIIPIYNMEAYLSRCLDSVLNNTYRNLEIICVDDGSQDGSAEILRAYAEKDSRIVPIFKENGGVSSARNAGLDRMTGEYLSFIDPDDFVHPQYFELLYRALQESGEEIAMCDFQKVEEGEALPEPKEIVFEPAELRKLSFSQIFRIHQLRAYSGGRFFRSKAISGLRFRQDLKYGEDTLFFSEVCEGVQSRRVAVMSYPLYYYFQRSDSLTKTATTSEQLRFANALFRKLFESKGNDDIYLVQLLKSCLDDRYLAAHIFSDRDSAKEADVLLKKSRTRLLLARGFGIKEKLVLFLMIIFPGLYWLYRVLRDPSMWKWEKVERKKRREERRARVKNCRTGRKSAEKSN